MNEGILGPNESRIVKSKLVKYKKSEENHKSDEFEGSLDFCFFSSMEKKDEKGFQ